MPGPVHGSHRCAGQGARRGRKEEESVTGDDSDEVSPGRGDQQEPVSEQDAGGEVRDARLTRGQTRRVRRPLP